MKRHIIRAKTHARRVTTMFPSAKSLKFTAYRSSADCFSSDDEDARCPTRRGRSSPHQQAVEKMDHLVNGSNVKAPAEAFDNSHLGFLPYVFDDTALLKEKEQPMEVIIKPVFLGIPRQGRCS